MAGNLGCPPFSAPDNLLLVLAAGPPRLLVFVHYGPSFPRVTDEIKEGEKGK